MRARLSEFDGKAVSMLGETEAAFAGEAGYNDALIALLAVPEGHIADGASWLLKSAHERGTHLTQAQVAALIAQLPAVSEWAAALHLCQSVQYWDVPAPSAAALANWIDPLLSHDRPFVRAWALDGLFRLARQHDEYGEAFAVALEKAQQDSAASVRARARNLL